MPSRLDFLFAGDGFSPLLQGVLSLVEAGDRADRCVADPSPSHLLDGFIIQLAHVLFNINVLIGTIFCHAKAYTNNNSYTYGRFQGEPGDHAFTGCH